MLKYFIFFIFILFNVLPADENNFVKINRNPDYLKKSFIKYLEEKKIDSNQIDETYSSKKNKIKKNLKKQKKKNRNHQVAIPINIDDDKGDTLFSWPLVRRKFWLSSFFGKRKNKDGTMGFHYGIDLAALKGTEVKAAADGVVVEAAILSGYGKTILIQHDKKYKTRYAHLNTIEVKVGDKVKKGKRIGTVGKTGFVRSSYGNDPSHLHFEVYEYNKQINPLRVLP